MIEKHYNINYIWFISWFVYLDQDIKVYSKTQNLNFSTQKHKFSEKQLTTHQTEPCMGSINPLHWKHFKYLYTKTNLATLYKNFN